MCKTSFTYFYQGLKCLTKFNLIRQVVIQVLESSFQSCLEGELFGDYFESSLVEELFKNRQYIINELIG